MPAPEPQPVSNLLDDVKQGQAGFTRSATTIRKVATGPSSSDTAHQAKPLRSFDWARTADTGPVTLGELARSGSGVPTRQSAADGNPAAALNWRRPLRPPPTRVGFTQPGAIKVLPRAADPNLPPSRPERVQIRHVGTVGIGAWTRPAPRRTEGGIQAAGPVRVSSPRLRILTA